MTTTDEPVDTSLLIQTTSLLLELSGSHDYEEITTTLRYLQQRDSDVEVEDICGELGQISPDHELEPFLDHLRYNGYIGENAERTRTRALSTIGYTAKMIQDRQDISPPVDLLATLPEDEALSAAGFGDLLSGVLKVIKQASSHVWIVSPFLSTDAFDRLRPALLSAVDSGSSISLVTRYLTYNDENGEFNRAFAHNILDSPLGDSVVLYEYVNNETWTTFHAKVVAADQREAYLGTANITGKGFLSNLELGVRFENAAARELIGLLDSLRSSDYLHEVERVGGGFARCSNLPGD